MAQPPKNKHAKQKKSSLALVVLGVMVIGFFPLWLIHMEWVSMSKTKTHSKIDSPELNINLQAHFAKDKIPVQPKMMEHVFEKDHETRSNIEQSVESKISPQAPKSKPQSSNHASPKSNHNHNGGIHVIFSTDCSPFQNWQSIVMYYSAEAVGQPGPVTRIASGCSDDEKAALIKMHKQLSSQFRIHFTPDFSLDKKTGKKYLFFNKPHGLLHWQQYGEYNESVVALLDPDMLFLRPITAQWERENVITGPDWGKEKWARVEKGKPAGQQYGLGARWLRFNREYICGEGSPCLTTSNSDANKYYPVGPPYILHVDDLKALADAWTTFVPKIYEEYPQLLAEMYAYCMAAAHLNLKHFKIDNLMVSNVDAGGEGWPWVDKFATSHDRERYMSGEIGLAKSTVLDTTKPLYEGDLPSVVHFCQNYRQGEWMFAKRRVPKSTSVTWPLNDGILACDHPLLAHPPVENAELNWYPKNEGGTKNLNEKQRARVSFTMNAAIEGINVALTKFKRDVCAPNSINLEKSTRIIPEHIERANKKKAAEMTRKKIR